MKRKFQMEIMRISMKFGNISNGIEMTNQRRFFRGFLGEIQMEFGIISKESERGFATDLCTPHKTLDQQKNPRHTPTLNSTCMQWLVSESNTD
jgi:hypothetical protein